MKHPNEIMKEESCHILPQFLKPLFKNTVQILLVYGVRLKRWSPVPPNFGDRSFGLLIVVRLPTQITDGRYFISEII